MTIELDMSRLQRAVQRTLHTMEIVEKRNEKLTREFIKDATDELHYIARTAIDKFYEDYEPNTYPRTFDLYNTYKITVTEDEWNIDFDPSFMQNWHRVDEQDPTYIFENSFIRGWHGGAIDGKGHPNPGTPYWRVPMTYVPTATGGALKLYSVDSPWRLALMSPSPYKEIVRKSNKYMQLETTKYHMEYNRNIDKFLNSLSRNLERIK